MTDSAFGYDDGQLRFHEGDALTRLGETNRALEALDEALRHYSEDNYLDRTLVLLDKAESLCRGGYAGVAVEQVVDAVAALDESRRDHLILARAREIGAAVPGPRDRARLVDGLAELLPRH